jgi:hypothetical protein
VTTPRLLAAGLLAAAFLVASPAQAAVGQYGPQAFGLYSFENAIARDQAETEPATQAGSHPYGLTTTIEFNHDVEREEPEECRRSVAGACELAGYSGIEKGNIYGSPRRLEVGLPPGFAVDPAATSVRCTEAELQTHAGCPPASTVGLALPFTTSQYGEQALATAIYNMVPPPGVPAAFAFAPAEVGFTVHIFGRLRSRGGYSLAGAAAEASQKLPVYGARLYFFGDPSGPVHDAQRGHCASKWSRSGVTQRVEREWFEAGAPRGELFDCPLLPAETTETPLLTMPTSCPGAPLRSTLSADSWQQPGVLLSGESTSPALSGCAGLRFEPQVEARPTTNAADSPSGLDFNLHVPQPENLNTEAEAHLKTAVVTLPAGISVNPSSADGLAACTPAQIGLETPSSEHQAFALPRPQARSFELELEGERTTSLSATASPAEVQAALEALPAIGAGNVEVSGGVGGWQVAFLGALARQHVPRLGGEVQTNATQTVSVEATGGSFNLSLAGHSTAATAKATYAAHSTKVVLEDIGGSGAILRGEYLIGPGIPLGDTIRTVSPSGTELELANKATEGGTAASVSTAFSYFAFAATVQQALETIPAIGSGNLTVSGGSLGPGPNNLRPYTIAFDGDLAGTDPETLTAEAAGLTGAGAGVQISAEAPATVPLQAYTTEPPGAVRFDEEAPSCPDAAKIGTVEVTSPLLTKVNPDGTVPTDPEGNPIPETLPGSVYLAAQHDNPFHSLLAIYIVVNDPERGILVKLPGHVEADPKTGQLTTTVEESPQLPFEDFKLHFFKGDRAPLRTPATCGHYETTTELTPWSHIEVNEEGEEFEGTPIATPADHYEISAAPGGGACLTSASSEPNAPHFSAGTLSPTAGAYSPFVLKLSRADGSQELHALNVTLPPGLTGKLAGVGECSEAQIAAAKAREHEGDGAAERESPSCPAATEVGTVDVAAGAGPSPFHVSGHAYLAGPYRGAPLSMVIVTPAVAGPFDLGTVVVRAGLYLNPETAQITVKSDEIPHILDGIPLDVRSIAVNIDRNQFTLNPTSCNPFAVTGTAFAASSEAALTTPFQVGGCRALAFRPHLAISLKGATRRAGHPALRAVLTYPKRGSYANIARAKVTLPHSEFLDQGHIGTVCTKVQFAEGSTPGEKCPAASIYGFARATTPLLDQPLEGPVYLRSSTHKLPDLVAALNGQIQIALAGKVDTGRGGGIRNSFEVVPDAPVSKFVLSMQGGHKGLLVNSENLCAPQAKNHALADFAGQNGKVSDTEPVVKNSCKGRKHKKGHRGHR